MKSRIKISLMRDERVREISQGEVTSYGMYNFKFNTPEPVYGGLFCQSIFGPLQDNVCGCKQHRPTSVKICPTCKVPNLSSSSRRDRMGHIETKMPYVNPLIYKLVGQALGITAQHMEALALGEIRYLIESDVMGVLRSTSGERYSLFPSSKETSKLSVYSLLSDLEELGIDPIQTLAESEVRDVRNYSKSGYNLYDLFNRTMPVSPPGLRDVSVVNNEINYHPSNQLYLRVLRSSLRYDSIIGSDDQTLLSLLPHEATVIQRAIASLFTKGTKDYRGNEIPAAIERLGGKEGLIRGNMLGKRMDFSGRSVIISGPELGLDTIGVPLKMMYELRKPDIIGELAKDIDLIETIAGANANAIKVAVNMYNTRHPAALERCVSIAESPKSWIILNRAPSLHRYSVMAHRVKVHDGKSIQLPPMCCSPYNADFDGDTMATHVMLSEQSLSEVPFLNVENNLMSSIDYNRPNLAPSHEQVVGLYMLTR